MLARHIRWSPVIALMAMTAACADSSVSPLSPKTDRLPGGAPNMLIIVNQMAADERSAEFTVDQAGGSFRLGKHSIVFPRNAICDPAKSDYGPHAWDSDCPPAREPIRIRAEIRTQDGREWVDFTPALRFRPSRNSSDWVWIYMLVGGDAQFNQSLSILWSPAIGVPGIDESLEDPTQRTYVSGGYAYRRIKHFSGYNVTSRSVSEESPRDIAPEQ
jgi:hypothetical protein